MLSRLSRNTLILLFSNGITAGLAFLLTILIGRGLGDAGLGRYAAIMAWILPLTILADFGISTLITRDVAEDRSRTENYIRQAVRWRWLLGGGLVLGIWISAPWMASDPKIVVGLRIASFLVLIDAIFSVYTAVWRAWEIMWPILVLNTGLLSLQVGGAALAVWQDWGLNGVLAAVVLADLVQLGATWLLWRWRFWPHLQGGTPVPARFLKLAFPFAIGGVLTTLYARMIFLVLEIHTSAEVVGWFAAASRFIEAAKMPALALFGAIFPMMSALSFEPAQLRNLLKKVTAGLAVYGLIGAIVLNLLSSFLLDFAFGSAFENAVPMLMLLGWSLIPSLLRQNLAVVHYALHQEQQVNRIVLAVLPVQLIAGTLLIEKWGGRGAAWAFLCTENLLMVFLWLSYRTMRDENWHSDTGILRE